jgi:hypothetical protein
MKITYEQLYRSYPVFNHLLDQPLPIQTSLKFQDLLESVNPHLKQIENIQNELIDKYAEDSDEEGVVEVPENKREEFIKELEKSLQNEIIISWDTIKLQDLGEQVNISVRGLETISYLLEDYSKMAVIS